jgi:hypothetical protein
MPTASGPNTKGEENLVFGYDLGDTKNSYKGPPTVNYTAHQTAVSQASYTPYSATSSGTWNAKHPNAIRAYNVDGGDITGYVNTGVTDWTNTYHAIWEYDPELKKPVVVMDCTDSNWKAKSFNPNTGQWASQGWGVGTKYVISWDQWVTHLDKSVHVGLYTKNSAGSNNFWDGLSSNSTTSRNTKVRTWQRVYHVYTASSNWDQTIDYQRIYMYGHYFRNGAGVKIKVANVQLEIDQDYPSPFTGVTAGTSGRTTRSATQGLLDLTGNSTIDLSNVSFDSNAQITFDGTSDHITGTLPIQGNGAPHTIEIVMSLDVNQTAVGSRRDPFTIGNAATHQYSSLDINAYNMNWYFYSRDTTFTNSPSMVTGQYYHMILSYAGGASNNTNKRVWFNGVEQTLSAGSSETSQLPDNPQFSVGRDRGRNTAYFPGQIPLFKVYNRALTEKEAKKNFNAIKGRFGI